MINEWHKPDEVTFQDLQEMGNRANARKGSQLTFFS